MFFGLPAEVVAAIIAGIFAVIGWLGNTWFSSRNERRQLRKRLSKRRTMLCWGFTDREVEEDISLIPETFDSMSSKDREVRRAYHRYIRSIAQTGGVDPRIPNLVIDLLEKMGDATGEKLEYEEDSRFSQNTADMINAESIKARKIIEQQRIEDQARQGAAQERDYRQRMLSGMEFALKDPQIIAAQKEMIGKAMAEWLQDPAFREHILKSTKELDDTQG
jgi:hypothetical protein